MGDKKDSLPLVAGVQGEVRNQDEFREAVSAGLEALQRSALVEAGGKAHDTPPADPGAIIAATEARLEAEALSASAEHMRRQTEQVREARQFKEDMHTLAEAQRAATARSANKRGEGRSTTEITRAIRDTNDTLDAGGIDWSEVPRASYAEWLRLAEKPLAGEQYETIRDAYLNRKHCADVKCPTGKVDAEVRGKATAALNAAWEKGRAINQAKRQSQQAVSSLGKGGR